MYLFPESLILWDFRAFSVFRELGGLCCHHLVSPLLRAFSPISASSSERWLNCPPSARLCEAYEDKGSDYAAEGTDAHALCEFRLKQALGIPADDPIENLSWYNEEMEDCAAG